MIAVANSGDYHEQKESSGVFLASAKAKIRNVFCFKNMAAKVTEIGGASLPGIIIQLSGLSPLSHCPILGTAFHAGYLLKDIITLVQVSEYCAGSHCQQLSNVKLRKVSEMEGARFFVYAVLEKILRIGVSGIMFLRMAVDMCTMLNQIHFDIKILEHLSNKLQKLHYTVSYNRFKTLHHRCG